MLHARKGSGRIQKQTSAKIQQYLENIDCLGEEVEDQTCSQEAETHEK